MNWEVIVWSVASIVTQCLTANTSAEALALQTQAEEILIAKPFQ